MGMVMRQSSTGLGLGTHCKSESKVSLSDSSTEGSNLKVGTTLQSEITPHTVVSPVAESPAREAEVLQSSPIIVPLPLGAILVSRPHELPAPVPVVPSEPPAPRFPEPELQDIGSLPNLADSPQPHESTLPVVEQLSGKLSGYTKPQLTVAKTPDVTSREAQEKPDPVQPRVESGLESINKDYGIQAVRVEDPKLRPVSIPIPGPAPAVIQVPERQVPPLTQALPLMQVPTQVVSEVREFPLLGPTVVTILQKIPRLGLA